MMRINNMIIVSMNNIISNINDSIGELCLRLFAIMLSFATYDLNHLMHRFIETKFRILIEYIITNPHSMRIDNFHSLFLDL
jgi:hypothetical protein